MTKKKSDLAPIDIFVGHCWRKKYESLANQLGDRLKQIYSSKVHYINRLKRPSRNIEITSISFLLLSCVIFLILMFNRPVLDLIWFYDCTWIEEWLSDHTIVFYFIALFLFLASRLMTITNVFDVYIDGKCVYSKEKGKTLPSVDDLLAVISYGIKTQYGNYQDYLK